MAAALGALLIYDFRLAVPFVLLFAGAFAVLRRTVVPGLFALACLPLVSGWLGRGASEVTGCLMLAGLVLFAHRKNLAAEVSQLLEHRQVAPRNDRPEL
jgi:hypothetical protein